MMLVKTRNYSCSSFHLLLSSFVFSLMCLPAHTGHIFNCSKPDPEPSDMNARCPCVSASTPVIEDRPAFWVHVPKTGSSFANCVYRVACKRLPRWASIRIKHNSSAGSKVIVPYFSKCFKKETRSCALEGGSRNNKGHHKLSGSTRFDPKRVAYITMLREPAARIVSGFHHAMHDCYNCSRKTKLSEYAASTAGIYTDYFGSNGSVDVAVERIKQFAFVGLTEYWDLSICLYHFLFGGPVPIETEFANLRPGKYGRSSPDRDKAAEQVKRLRQSLPAHLSARLLTDNLIYAAGQAKFWDDVRRYRLSCAHSRKKLFS